MQEEGAVESLDAESGELAQGSAASTNKKKPRRRFKWGGASLQTKNKDSGEDLPAGPDLDFADRAESPLGISNSDQVEHLENTDAATGQSTVSVNQSEKIFPSDTGPVRSQTQEEDEPRGTLPVPQTELSFSNLSKGQLLARINKTDGDLAAVRDELSNLKRKLGQGLPSPGSSIGHYVHGFQGLDGDIGEDGESGGPVKPEGIQKASADLLQQGAAALQERQQFQQSLRAKVTEAKKASHARRTFATKGILHAFERISAENSALAELTGFVPTYEKLPESFEDLPLWQENADRHRSQRGSMTQWMREQVRARMDHERELGERYTTLYNQWIKKRGKKVQSAAKSAVASDLEEKPLNVTPGRSTRTSSGGDYFGDESSGADRLAMSARTEEEMEGILEAIRAQERENPTFKYLANAAPVPAMYTAVQRRLVAPQKSLETKPKKRGRKKKNASFQEIEEKKSWAPLIAPLFVSTNGFRIDPIGDQTRVNSSSERVWSDTEKSIFMSRFLLYPKEFNRIAEFLPCKRTEDVVNYYYRNKKTLNLKKKLRDQVQSTTNARGGGLVAGPFGVGGIGSGRVSMGIAHRRIAAAVPRSLVSQQAQPSWPGVTSATGSQSVTDSPAAPPRAGTPFEESSSAGATWSEGEHHEFLLALGHSLREHNQSASDTDWSSVSAGVSSKTEFQCKNYYHNLKVRYGRDKLHEMADLALSEEGLDAPANSGDAPRDGTPPPLGVAQPLSEDEISRLVQLVEEHGRKWKLIAGEMGRSQHSLKVYYTAHKDMFGPYKKPISSKKRQRDREAAESSLLPGMKADNTGEGSEPDTKRHKADGDS